MHVFETAQEAPVCETSSSDLHRETQPRRSPRKPVPRRLDDMVEFTQSDEELVYTDSEDVYSDPEALLDHGYSDDDEAVVSSPKKRSAHRCEDEAQTRADAEIARQLEEVESKARMLLEEAVWEGSGDMAEWKQGTKRTNEENVSATRKGKRRAIL